LDDSLRERDNMSTTIHFSSGKEQSISAGKLDKFIMELKGRGIKLMIDRTPERTLIIPLNSSTLEFIEDWNDEVEESDEVVPCTPEEELMSIKADLEDSIKEVEDKKDTEEKQKDKMKELMDKSNCTHPESSRVYYRQDTSKGSRYFPVCGFCGKRERYVKADSLSDEVKESASLWED
jgi:hypothetical protein